MVNWVSNCTVRRGQEEDECVERKSGGVSVVDDCFMTGSEREQQGHSLATEFKASGANGLALTAGVGDLRTQRPDEQGWSGGSITAEPDTSRFPLPTSPPTSALDAYLANSDSRASKCRRVEQGKQVEVAVWDLQQALVSVESVGSVKRTAPQRKAAHHGRSGMKRTQQLTRNRKEEVTYSCGPSLATVAGQVDVVAQPISGRNNLQSSSGEIIVPEVNRFHVDRKLKRHGLGCQRHNTNHLHHVGRRKTQALLRLGQLERR